MPTGGYNAVHCEQDHGQYRMRKVPFLLLSLLGLATSVSAQQQLPPPDVTFFAAIESSRTDFGRIGIDEDVPGVQLRGGLWLNDVRFGRWVLGVEGAYNQLGNTTTRTEFDRQPTVQELNQNGNLVNVNVATERERNVGGLELGARLYDSELFYIRAGAYLYSYRAREDRRQTFTSSNGSSFTNDLLPRLESNSTLGPYLGAGFAFPLTERLRLTAGISSYYIESEPLNSASLGLQVRGRR